jgi:hypothetical protein
MGATAQGAPGVHGERLGEMALRDERGFASMEDVKQKEIASKGGKAAHEKGTAHEFSSEEARVAGRKGGEAVSRDRGHMADIGRKGGETVSRDREHMAGIGREGGDAVSKDREHMASIGRKGGEAVSKDRGHMADIGREGGEASGSGHRGAQSRGVTHEQHAQPGKQSHKND